MKLEFSRQVFENSNFKFHENPFSGSRVVSCRQTNGQTDITKLVVPFRYFANTPKTINCYPKAAFDSSMNIVCNVTPCSLVCEFCNNLFVVRHYL
jgi:hypothetical protein